MLIRIELGEPNNGPQLLLFFVFTFLVAAAFVCWTVIVFHHC